MSEVSNVALALSCAILSVACTGLLFAFLRLRHRHRHCRHALDRIAAERNRLRFEIASGPPAPRRVLKSVAPIVED